MFFNPCVLKQKKTTRIQLFLVTFIYSDYSHFRYKLGFFLNSRFKGPRVPKKNPIYTRTRYINYYYTTRG
jgi:hypothetical protein